MTSTPTDVVARLRELANDLERYNALPNAEQSAAMQRAIAIELDVERRALATAAGMTNPCELDRRRSVKDRAQRKR